MNLAELGRLKSVEHRLNDLEARIERLEHAAADVAALRSLVTELREGLAQVQES